MEPVDEFDEFDVTEDEFDAMMAEGRPVTVVTPGDLLSLFGGHRIESPSTYGSRIEATVRHAASMPPLYSQA